MVRITVHVRLFLFRIVPFHIHQVFMYTLEERYDIERNREVKNIPLLKTLKEQIQKSFDVAAQTAQIRLELKEAELTEDWDKYAKLQATLTGILVKGEVFLHATRSDVPTVGRDEITLEVIDDPTVGRDDVTLGVVDDTVRTTDSDSNDDDEDEVDLRSGAMHGSPQELLKQLSDFANSRHFTVRREKHAIVCSNAGQFICSLALAGQFETHHSHCRHILLIMYYKLLQLIPCHGTYHKHSTYTRYRYIQN
jgi:hypothetical protein